MPGSEVSTVGAKGRLTVAQLRAAEERAVARVQAAVHGDHDRAQTWLRVVRARRAKAELTGERA